MEYDKYETDKYSSASRVYINPNFQRNKPITQSTSVHINPCFPQKNNVPPIQTNKPKIYVNPNFVKTTLSAENYLQHPAAFARSNYTMSTEYVSLPFGKQQYLTHQAQQPVCTVTTSGRYSSIHPSSYFYQMSAPTATNCQFSSNVASISPMQPLPSSSKLEIAAIPVTKSRYTLVRKNAPNTLQTINSNTKVSTKLKINKYKTVSMIQIKKNNDRTLLKLGINQKQEPHHQPQSQYNTLSPAERIKRNPCLKPIQSRYKLVKKVSVTPVKLETKNICKKRSTLSSSRLQKSKNLVKSMDKTKFKKNNIPCPLFKKFGKCLRASKGRCDFLHDKKHVSICRRFLQGACHNKECLLSHELSAKKMPTCYFYLKGMCTKEECPYLHVKLNDQTKICTDFLKGYCENGEKCLNRHINMCSELAIKGTCSRKKCPYSHGNKMNWKSNKTLILRSFTKTERKFLNPKDHGEKENEGNKTSHKGDTCGQTEPTDQKELSGRYYKEVVENESDAGIENIKPTRCKLGELPSFIEL